MRTIIVTSVALLGFGCATIFNGTKQSIDIKSDPPGATVLSDGQPVCDKTPCTANFSRGSEHVLQLQLAGYYPYRLILRQHGSSWMAANLILTGGTGIIVDLITGATWYLAPEELSRKLEPMPGRLGLSTGGETFAWRRPPIRLLDAPSSD